MARRGAGPSRTVPRTSPYWLREVAGVFVLLDGLPDYDDDMGAKWCRGMRAHYIERLHELYDAPPANVRVRYLRDIPQE